MLLEQLSAEVFETLLKLKEGKNEHSKEVGFAWDFQQFEQRREYAIHDPIHDRPPESP